MSILRSRWLAFYLGLVVIAADSLSKYLVYLFLSPMHRGYYWYPYGGIGVFKDLFGVEFSITHTINRGAAWGIFSDYQTSLMLVRLALITGLLVYLLFMNKRKEYEVPLALITAGAFGNVIDYFWFGHVIDMFHFVLWGYDYPVFNVADAAITVGIVWLFFLSFKEKKSAKTIKKKAR